MKVFRINEDMKLSIMDNAVIKMLNYCQSEGLNESGGILLGKVRNDFSEFIITDISEPCSRDISGRRFFVRNKDNAQEIVNESWKLSNGEINYLGEWHTHSEINPRPSFIDRRLIGDSLSKNKNTPLLIFLIIVGMDGFLYVGYRRKGTKKLIQLEM